MSTMKKLYVIKKNEKFRKTQQDKHLDPFVVEVAYSCFCISNQALTWLKMLVKMLENPYLDEDKLVKFTIEQLEWILF